jgi:hypothetical protein
MNLEPTFYNVGSKDSYKVLHRIRRIHNETQQIETIPQ